MTDIDRRSLLRTLMAAPVAASLAWTQAEASLASELAQAAQAAAAQTGAAFTPKFFSAHEWQTVRLLVDLIIPRDERSGSATDAGVPEFMDFMMIDQPVRQVAMRGGLAWLDRVCEARFDKRFAACADGERTAILDELAWAAEPGPIMPATDPGTPDPVPPADRGAPLPGPVLPRHGVLFFNSFRDLTATGFWTSKMGIEDLRYMGNRVVRTWSGCPDEALKKLGVSYDG